MPPFDQYTPPGISPVNFASEHTTEWFHRRTETLCYQSQLFSRWREIRACNDNACGESKRQNSHDSLLDLTFLIAATDPKAPIYRHLISRQRLGIFLRRVRYSSTTGKGEDTNAGRIVAQCVSDR